ncbi:MAG: magnesium transporter, partial [Gemmatimonadetes bacterium]|nr:magnesium transporter [Gemmatimonadota bacterium]
SQILARMRDRRSIGDLLLYPDDDAGGLMTTNVAGLRAEWTAAHALNVLRRSGMDMADLQQLFAVDREGVLLGRLSLSELVFAPPGVRVRDVMHADVASVTTDTDQEETARVMQRYELRSVPVVDAAGRLQGAIAIEDLVDVAEEEATEDMFKIVGLGGEARPFGPLAASVRVRLPWLLVNLATALLAGFVLSLFEPTIDRMVTLAAFLPVVMGQAGISGNQTLIIVVRSLALGEVATSDARRLLMREALFATAQWLTVCVLLGAIALAWRQDIYLALVVAGAMALNLLVAAAAGVLVPLGMKTMRFDPAASSAPLVTTLTDISGIIIYLGLATAFLTVFRAG